MSVLTCNRGPLPRYNRRHRPVPRPPDPWTRRVSTRSPEEGLRGLKKCYKEHIINRVACSEDTWDINKRMKTKNEGLHHNTDSMTLQKSVTRTKPHVKS